MQTRQEAIQYCHSFQDVYGLGLESSGDCLQMVLAGFLFYLLPCTVEMVIAGIVLLEECIRSFT